VNSNIRQILKLTTSLVLYGLISGCEILEDVRNEKIRNSPDFLRTGKNHYEPLILSSNQDRISIKYLSVGPNAEHEQVMQLIFDHCHGAYVETSRVELRGYDTVEAACTHEPVSLQ